jgi:hypothetical protein
MERAQSVERGYLKEVIASFDPVRMVKTDLVHWFPLLNRFDEIMENIISTCRFSPIQGQHMDKDDHALLLQVLKFTTVLLENSSNRSFYSSCDVVYFLSLLIDVALGCLALYYRARCATSCFMCIYTDIVTHSTLTSYIFITAFDGGFVSEYDETC